LYSRPGYLQIFHDPKPGSYEIPVNSINIVPSTKADPANLEYLAGSEERPEKEVTTTKPEPIQLLSANVTTSNHNQLKRVEPYAVVDMVDIATKAGLDNTVTKHRSKHQRNNHKHTNRETLILAFGARTDDSTITQVELNEMFYTVPIYVNLHTPMTINPSYIKQ